MPINEQIGNHLPVPGFSAETTIEDDELLYATAGFNQVGCTIQGGNGVILLGTHMMETAPGSNLYMPRVDGAQPSAGLLRQTVDTTDGGQLGNLVTSGQIKSDKITNQTATAVTELNGRIDVARGAVIV